MRSRRRQPPHKSADRRVEAWAEMAYAYHRITRRMEHALSGDGLTLPQFEVLIRLQLDGPMMQTALAAKLVVSKGNISGLISRMAKARLVRRTTDRSDRRAHQISLTPSGRKKLAQTFPKHIALIDEIMAPLRPKEVDALLATSAQLLADGERPPPCPPSAWKIN